MQRSWDLQRFLTATQSLEDHCHTVLEAHAEVPEEYKSKIRDCALTVGDLNAKLETLKGDEENGKG